MSSNIRPVVLGLMALLLTGAAFFPVRAQRSDHVDTRLAVQETMTANLSVQVKKVEDSLAQLSRDLADQNWKHMLSILGVAGLIGDRAATRLYARRRKKDDDALEE